MGQPTAVMPTTAGFATYSMVGATTPTANNGTSGTLSSPQFQVDFAAGQINTTIVTAFNTVSDANLNFSGSSFASASSNIKGFFSGPNANRAGLIYNGPLTSGGSFSGAVVFQDLQSTAAGQFK